MDQVSISPELDKAFPEGQTFSIEDWAMFVNQNPQYLQVIDKSPQRTVFSLNKVIDNLDHHIKPLSELQHRMSIDVIIQEQRKQYQLLYSTCLSSPNFTTTARVHNEPPQSYFLEQNIIRVRTPSGPKILLPKSLIGLFLAYTHLSAGHAGVKRMTALLEPYSFPNKDLAIRNLTSRCYGCQLSNRPRQNPVGTTPIFHYALQCLHLDLAEDISPAGKFNHCLIATCPLSDFLVAFPLRSKTAEEISHILLYSILQYFSVEYICTDNAPCFQNKQFIAFLAAINIEKVYLTSLNPQGKGAVEIKVKLFKQILKKMLSSHSDFQWHALPYLATKFVNHSISSKTQFSPAALIYGSESPHSQLPFKLNQTPRLHPLVTNSRATIEKMNKQINEMLVIAKQHISLQKENMLNTVNKNKKHRDFNIHDIVFVEDRKIIPGASRPLKTLYSPSPYVVVRVQPTSTVVRRLADGFESLYANNMLKRYTPLDPAFAHLPRPVANIIRNKFEHLDTLMFDIIRRYDTFSEPQGLILNNDENEDFENINPGENTHIMNNIDVPPPILKSDNSEPHVTLDPTDYISNTDPPTSDIIILNNNNAPPPRTSAQLLAETSDIVVDRPELSLPPANNSSNSDLNTQVTPPVILHPPGNNILPPDQLDSPGAHPDDSTDTSEDESDNKTGISLRSGRKVRFKV